MCRKMVNNKRDMSYIIGGLSVIMQVCLAVTVFFCFGLG